MFEQRHFEAIAKMMQELRPRESLIFDPTEECMGRVNQWHRTIIALQTLFARHNTRFDAVRFGRACEPGANVRARKAPPIED